MPKLSPLTRLIAPNSLGWRWVTIVACSGVLLLSGCSWLRGGSVSQDAPPPSPDSTPQKTSPKTSQKTSQNQPPADAAGDTSVALPTSQSETQQPSPGSTGSVAPSPPPIAKQPLTPTEVDAAEQKPTASQTRPQEGPQDKGVPLDDEQVLKLAKKTEQGGAIARQNSGESTLSLLLINLKAERLLQPQFATSLEALPGKIPTETDEYRFKIASAASNKAIAVAEPKTEGLPSYVGAVYIGSADQLPVSGICKSNVPSQTAPNAPSFVKDQVVCAQGSTAVEAE